MFFGLVLNLRSSYLSLLSVRIRGIHHPIQLELTSEKSAQIKKVNVRVEKGQTQYKVADLHVGTVTFESECTKLAANGKFSKQEGFWQYFKMYYYEDNH